MIHLSNKAKQYALIALKVLILTGVFSFIYHKITAAESLDSMQIPELLDSAYSPWIVIFFLMAITNWCLEIIKWKTVVTGIKQISFAHAAKQCLMSLSASLITPNRIGEYGAKALYFKSEQRKKVMVLNLFSNLSQLSATVFFGIPGLLVFIGTYSIPVTGWKLALLIAFLLLFFAFAYKFRQKELLIKGLSIEKVYSFLVTVPMAVKLKVILLSLLRYVVFSSLFYLILNFYGGTLGFWEAAPLITSMYFMASVLPGFFIFDVAIKGGVALWLFSFTETSELTVLVTVLSMWVLNFGIPALWGSYYIARFKPLKA